MEVEVLTAEHARRHLAGVSRTGRDGKLLGTSRPRRAAEDLLTMTGGARGKYLTSLELGGTSRRKAE